MSPMKRRVKKDKSKKSDPRKSPVAVSMGIDVLSGSMPCFHIKFTKWYAT